jgi:chemotaxis protein CheX
MNLHNLIVNSICQSMAQIFSTMLGVEIEQGDASIESGSLEANDGVVSLIGLAGSWAGMGSITCSPNLACRICSQMLMTESSAVDEEVLDAVAELTNMVVGNVKTDLEAELGPLGLSIPTVVFGRNFRTKSAGHADWIVVRFSWQDEPLVVRVCLAPNERGAESKSAHPAVHQADPICPVDV